MKKFFMGIICLLFFGHLSAQDAKIAANNEAGISNHIFLKTGLNYNSFQDVKYSNLAFSGIGASLGFGFENRKPNASWIAGFDLAAGLNGNSRIGATGYSIFPSIYLQHLRNINEKFSIGGRWDILDAYAANRNNLGNNSLTILISSNIYASAQYKLETKKGKSWVFGLDLGLLSFNRENSGFAFSAPQNILEEGEFNYQNPALDSPLGLSVYELEPIGKFNNIRTSVTFRGKKRSSFTYAWQMKSVAETSGYPLTIGLHFITYRLDLVYKTK